MRLLLPSAMIAALLAVAGQGLTANAAASPLASESASPATQTPLNRVTIEATQRRTLRLQVDNFITSVVAKPWGDALYRWNEPVCPLVAGLPKAEGEFILARISQAAVAAHAPLDGRVCRPNLFVLALDSPDPLLEKWWAHSRKGFAYGRLGIEAVEQFLHSREPIRVWYNTTLSCTDGVPSGPGLSPLRGVNLPDFLPPVCTLENSRLLRSSISTTIASAVVIVDLRQIKEVTIGQMADYVALAGLTNVKLDADPVPEPSILQLFARTAAPQGLSAWDRALLYSVYNTNQWDYLQLSEVKATMVRRLAP